MRAVIFNESGETLNSLVIQQGANATINPEECSKRIMQIIADLLEGTSLSFEDINQYSLGIAGISDDRARDFLFKKLDEKKISNKTHLSSDVNPIFEMNCSDNSAILLSIGTGIICLARGIDGNIIKAGGLGLDKDLGSGYWMGKELILNLSFSSWTIWFDAHSKRNATLDLSTLYVVWYAVLLPSIASPTHSFGIELRR